MINTALETGVTANRLRESGLDNCRCCALLLVILQHALSVTDHLDWTSSRGVNIGQVGVAIFLAIAGWLAGKDRRKPTQWLARRLARLYPAYWIAMTISFLATWYTGYKQFDEFQVISQMMGLGLFTHRGSLVNTPSWFISLLLVCYGVAFISKLTLRPQIIAFFLLVPLGTMLVVNYEPLYTSHALAFVITFVVRTGSQTDDAGRLRLVQSSALTLALSIAFPSLGHTAIALAVLSGSLLLTFPSRVLQHIADCSYEFYLLHGMFFVGSVRYFPFPQIVCLALAIVITYVASTMLHSLANRLKVSPKAARILA